MSPRSRTSSRNGTPDGWPPRWLTPVPAADVERGDGKRFVDFTQLVCRVDKDSVAAKAGTLLVMRPWQQLLLGHLLAKRPDGRLRHREALIGIARKNGKSGIGAALGLGGLVLGPQGGEVYSCAADKDQARIVFNTARKMVKLDPELSEMLKVYRDVIECEQTGSIYKVLSAEAYTKEGLNPHLVIFDEVHAQPDRGLWDVMALAMGAREEPLMVGITTAGVRTDTTGQDSLCYTLYQYGQRVANGEVDDPTFFMAWWEPARADADHRDPDTWRQANPGIDDLLSTEDLASKLLRTPENEYRTKRCNQWVSTQQAWFPTGLWESLKEPRSVPDGAEVVLAFDGSFSGDSTGLTVHAVEDLHIDVVECWERPPGDADWRVDPDEVETVLRQAFVRWKVRHCVYDPRIWQQLFERLAAEGYAVESMPQGLAMIQAAQRFYDAAKDHKLTQSGDVRLTRHVGNAVIKATPQGWRVQKESPNSPRKIDLAICAIMGHAYAAAVPEPAQPFFASWR
ncbi:MAG TPA: terminase large subunit [Jiangellaceae bacterium]|nr:terminase large subunit [Jiangellaceae bacterium]